MPTPSRRGAAPAAAFAVLPARAALAALAALVLIVLAAAGCGDRAAGRSVRPRHVLLITVDTLRADHLSAYGYPRATGKAVEGLAADGVLFERAIAQWPKTGVSFASMFTGRYPQSTGLTHKAAIRVPDEYLTLPELMARQGYTTVAVNSNAVLSKDLGWDRGFSEYLQTWDLAGGVSEDPREYRRTMNAGRVNELALPLLARHRGDERLFAWIHYSDPHAPYFLPDDVANPFLGDRWDTGEETVELDDPRSTALDDHRELPYYVAQYDGNVWYADGRIGELLERAGELGLLDDTVVVFTADHGESLGEHGYYFGHGRLPYDDGVHVPLVIRWPSGGVARGARVDRPVELVDLYPTLAALVAPEMEIPGLEGHSLLPLLGVGGQGGKDGEAAAAFRLAFSEAGGGSPTTHFRSVQDGEWKLIYHPELKTGKETVLPASYELYHLSVDPGETANLFAADSEPLRRLRRDLFAWMKGSDWIRLSRDEIQARNDETRKALRALGYVE